MLPVENNYIVFKILLLTIVAYRLDKQILKRWMPKRLEILDKQRF